MNDLPVCQECGWHKLKDHLCQPEAGKCADSLARQAGVPSTKRGYGSGKLTVLMGEGRSLTFRAHRDGTFCVESLHWLPEMDEAGAARLVEFLAGLSSGGTAGS